ncbi:DsbA family oxidoreductase, partial [Salsipaludibacter albus]|uniref:DsbA family oxidoreductase n=1 Tax=Salsipaludibacter albus TaxID=2849650 RepID=UPI001EE46902
GNTFDAHRVLHHAAANGRQHEVKARLLAGYHTEGVDVADHAELVRLASEGGLDADDVRRVLDSGAHADDVRADQALARQFGIRGVPFFVFDRTHGLSGAQPVDVLVRALDQVHTGGRQPQEVPAGHDHGPDEACVGDSCRV